MPDGNRFLAQGDEVLVLVTAAALAATHGNKHIGQIDTALVARDAVQIHQPHDLAWIKAEMRQFRGIAGKGFFKVTHSPKRTVKQRSLAGGFKVCCRHGEKMPMVVQLVMAVVAPAGQGL